MLVSVVHTAQCYNSSMRMVHVDYCQTSIHQRLAMHYVQCTSHAMLRLDSVMLLLLPRLVPIPAQYETLLFCSALEAVAG